MPFNQRGSFKDDQAEKLSQQNEKAELHSKESYIQEINYDYTTN